MTDTLSVPHDALVGVSVANKVMFAGGGSYLTNNYCDVVDIYTEVAIGIQETNFANTFDVFPNPANDMLTFSETLNEVSVINLFGEITFSTSEPTNTISVSDLPDGIYFIRSGNTVQKFMVKH
jgi:hypothetical protein